MFHYDNDFRDKNGERYMLPIRIQKLLGALWGRAVWYREPLRGIEMHDGKLAFADCAAADWQPFDPDNDHWGGIDHYVWFRHSFTVPEALEGKILWYSVEAGEKGYWQWANPQMCLYLNGKCICGMDSNHRDAEFCLSGHAGDRYDVCISGYTDTVYYERPAQFRPHLASVEPETLALYYDLKVAYETAHELDTDDTARIDLIHAVNEAFNILALDEEDSAKFLESVRAASAYVAQKIYTGHTGGKPVIAAVGSTHIDVAWLWRYEQTREKACRSFATAVRLIDKNPEYIFMCSQPQLYEFVKEDDPKLYEEVRRCIREGRWEVEGSMWVEADTNLAGGESLVRQILFAKRFFREEFDRDNKVLWLPDVFGYCAAMPQILKKSGVDYFMTTKISWNEFDKLPYDTFFWRGIDGSEVLSHFVPTRERADTEKDWMTTYNGHLDPRCVLGAWQRYQQKDLNREVLCSFGHGDGGGGTTQEMVEYGKRISKGIQGCPDLKFSTVRDFFDRLQRDVGSNPKTPCWDGELYFEYHRGTYTSVAGIKRRNRKNEIRSHDAENLSVLRGILQNNLPETYPAADLFKSWKLLLLNQFHDVLPGSSIGPVYDDAYAHHAQIEAITAAASENAITAIAGSISAEAPSVAVFNTLSFARTAPVSFRMDGVDNVSLQRGGEIIPAVKQPDGSFLFVAKNVPAKGYCTYKLLPGMAAAKTADLHTLENDFLRVEFDDNMNITRVFSKQAGREMMKPGSLAGRLIAFTDNPRVDDAWNLMAYYEEKSEFIDDVESAEIVEANEIRTVLRVKRRYRKSHFTVDYILYAENPGLEMQFDIDWKEKDLIVKLDFPAKVNTNKASFEIQFGNVERPIHRNTLWDFARFEVCAHKWVDLSDNGFGISLFNDCKYGYDVTREHIRLSVLRCATYPNPAQDKCRHEFSCMLLPHNGGLDAAKTTQTAYSFNYPLYAAPTGSAGTLPAEYSLLTCDRENVIVETVKQAEDGKGVILRAYECANCGCTAELKLGYSFREAWLCDMLEQPVQKLESNGQTVSVPFSPFEIQTVLIK